MIEVRIEIDGKPARSGDMQSVLEKAVLGEMKGWVQERVGDATCPEHGKPPQVTFSGRDLNNLTARVTGCCDQLIQMVQDRLK